MSQLNLNLPVVAFALLTAACGFNVVAAEKATDKAAKKNPVVTYVIVPVEAANRPLSLQDGCWLRIYSGNNYTGEMLTVHGPVAMANMVGPFGFDWTNRVKSIETGGRTTATIYDNDNFKDLVAQIKPGNKVPDVSKRMGFFDDFSSMQVNCS